MLVVHALEMGQLTDGGMPPVYGSMHQMGNKARRDESRKLAES